MASNRSPLIVMRDTRAWQFQVWASFGVAVFLCATGLAYLPGQALDRAFMVMGYVFCLSTVFVLSKAVRDSHQAALSGVPETPMWRLVVWGGFAVAMGLTGWGLLRMEINDTYRAYLGVSWLYLVTSAFTLAKSLRDRHEADLGEARVRGELAGRQQVLNERAAAAE
ncbi:MAG: YiaA/YiaB family inner membrane protein [Hydrogenophaga sp.]|uniref:YiaA/YiaB family inner membrane protein n=2 Tax=Hydrogenophaga sp. TaxID=1904254 RepID=UPI002731CCCA|nr:YiaA/YiaB family inner membrane protein [Hydrogenophaga sp.]MDP2252417.1 YiaA/YiaB family inner membrane protein [Hydrogenophaga sp.]